MLLYTDSTVFNVNAQVIVNTVNCVGVMGNGLALECRLRYPEMFVDYVARCRLGVMRIGEPYLYRYAPEFGILNFPCKEHWKFPSKVTWIRQGLAGFRAMPVSENITSIAFPPLGCDLGRLSWRDIQPVMEEYLADLPYPVYICRNREPSAAGVEGQMLAILNDSRYPFWLSSLDLPPRQRAAVLAALPLTRFYDLRQVTGIGKQTYERLHLYAYTQVKQEI